MCGGEGGEGGGEGGGEERGGRREGGGMDKKGQGGNGTHKVSTIPVSKPVPISPVVLVK